MPSETRWTLRGEVVYVTPSELAEILLDAKLVEPTVSFTGEGVVAVR